MNTKIKMTAVGDTSLARHMAHYRGLGKLKEFIARGDAKFVNLETTLNRNCYASQYSGGTWLRSDPEILVDVADMGFNMLSFANNHTLDFSYDGLLQTLDALDQFGFVHTGVGENLSEAAAPAYLETENGRVALISTVSTFNPAAMAGEQSRRLPGRPGVNGLRHNKTVNVTEKQMNALYEIADATTLNAENNALRASGYLSPLPEGVFDFENIRFKESDTPGITTSVNAIDMARIEKNIREASLQADLVVVSIHCHERNGNLLETPPEFLKEFAHKCIDIGTNAVIGHGPHVLRPVEIYKKRPIFYSLGDFILQLENFEYAPEDFYAKFGLTSDAGVHELLRVRTREFSIGLMRNPTAMEAVVPFMEFENGDLTHLEFMPVKLEMTNKTTFGLPSHAPDSNIIKRFAEMSAPFGTKIEDKDGIGTVIL